MRCGGGKCGGGGVDGEGFFVGGVRVRVRGEFVIF